MESRVVYQERPLLKDLLRSVSRSFHLTLQVLPRPVRSQIGLAYLLARATDTIADTALVSSSERLTALSHLRQRILGTTDIPLDLRHVAKAQPAGASDSERELLTRIEQAITILGTFEKRDIEEIRWVLDIITSGQELDLRRFEPEPEPDLSSPSPSGPDLSTNASSGSSATIPTVRALESRDELEDYTWRVAGCVGEFWSRLCRTHLFPDRSMDEAAWFEDARLFGKGLQFVNILRDLPKDLKVGRCYLPLEDLRSVDLQPADLLNANNEARLRPVYNHWLNRADTCLEAGWRYTQRLPRSHGRLRLGCAWPVLIGMRTVQLLRTRPVLDPSIRIKVPRADIRRIQMKTFLTLPFPSAWARLPESARRIPAN